MSADGFKLRLQVPAAAVAACEAALQAMGAAVVRDLPEDGAGGPDEVPIEVYFAGRPRQASLMAALTAAGLEPPPLAVEALPALDWVAESQRHLPALRAGRFFLYGAHASGQRPVSAVSIRIDAGQAFGTGHHESTRGCLLALDGLARRRGTGRRRPGACLDLGCGSGVLAIAMAKAWRVPVLAVDIDPVAAAVAKENARLNGVAALVRTATGDRPDGRALGLPRPYDVITANILAGPLRALAGGLSGALSPGGRLILSGLLKTQERSVLAPYRARGLRPRRRILLGDWVTLVLGR